MFAKLAVTDWFQIRKIVSPVLLVGIFLLVLPDYVPAQEEGFLPQDKKSSSLEKKDTPTLERLEQIIKDQQQKLMEQDRLTLEQRDEIERMRRKFKEIQKQLEDQNKLTEEQRKQIEEMERLLLSVHNRLQEVLAKAPEALATDVGEQIPTDEEESVEREADIAPDVVKAGDFPGSIWIPGTDASIKIGGRVKFSMVYNLDALGVDDRFITAEIPIRGTEEAGKGARLTMSARSTRLNFDLRTPTGVGHMRAFVEGDFAGEGEGYQLRHAYGQYRRALVGKTWSTSADPQARPEGIDFEGLNSRNLIRQAQFRVGLPLSEKVSLAFALEDPKADITGGGDVNLVPDFITRARWEKPYGPLGHLQGSFLFRQIRGEPDTRPNKTAREFAYGIFMSGKLDTPMWNQKDNLVFQINIGEGIGRYINDLQEEGGQDAVFNPLNDRLETLPVFGAYTGYQHWWGETTRSNFLYGYVRVHNRSFQPGDAYHHTERISMNLIWSPIERIDIGVEALYGLRENKDHGKGTSSQLQFAVKFLF